MSALANLLNREVHQLRADASAQHEAARQRKDVRRTDFTAGQLHAYTEVLKILIRVQPTPRRRGNQ